MVMMDVAVHTRKIPHGMLDPPPKFKKPRGIERKGWQEALESAAVEMDDTQVARDLRIKLADPEVDVEEEWKLWNWKQGQVHRRAAEWILKAEHLQETRRRIAKHDQRQHR